MQLGARPLQHLSANSIDSPGENFLNLITDDTILSLWIACSLQAESILGMFLWGHNVYVCKTIQPSIHAST
jgi:hypothetical protein